MRVYWSRHQAQTRRNTSRRRPTEEAAVGVGVGVAGVVEVEDGEKEMGKWMLTRVRKIVVGRLCGLYAWFKSANADATDQYTSCAFFLRALHSLYTPRLRTLVYRYYYRSQLRKNKFLKAVVHAKRSGDGKTSK